MDSVFYPPCRQPSGARGKRIGVRSDSDPARPRQAPAAAAVVHSIRALLRAQQGDRKGAEADIATAIRIGRGFGHFHHTAYSIGQIYSVLGDLDRAQEWIENAANQGSPCYTLFETDPFLDRLRGSARFRTFLTALRKEWERIPGETD